jgi:hypothetical protein
MFGPTYETRNQQYDMDAGMREILQEYLLLQNREQFLEAFFEGLAACRIWERPTRS